jgi:hypothetical protein
MFDPIIDVITDAGTSNDTNFTIGDAPATITSLNPSTWTAGTSFTLTITGTGFGSNPTVSITDPNNAVSTGNFTSSPDGTSIQIGVTVNGNDPSDEVATVTVNPAGLINGAQGFTCVCNNPTGSAMVQAAITTATPPTPYSEITIVSWVNGDAIPLPTGENSGLQGALSNDTPLDRAACAATLASWYLDYMVFVNNSQDVAYADAWLLRNSKNSPPPNTLSPAWTGNVNNFRMLNDFKINSGGVPIISSAVVGTTPDPCGELQPIAAEAHTFNGWVNFSPLGNEYQLAESRVGPTGQIIGENLNNTPSIPWIYSVVEFDQNRNPIIPSITAIFPTYSLYVNGQLYATYPQTSAVVFSGLNATQSQLIPSQIP